MTRSNLGSRSSITFPCDLDDLAGWFEREAAMIELEPVREIVLRVASALDVFVSWPGSALLLWDGCVRPRGSEKHSFPIVLKTAARAQRVSLNSLSNGPVVTAFEWSGGTRPQRSGSTNGWSVHHFYSGKFPYPGRSDTTHAVKDGVHFTQAAGLVAIHPIADQMCDEFPALQWLLRATAFKKFGYDPDHVFSQRPHDRYGFAGHSPVVVYAEHLSLS